MPLTYESLQKARESGLDNDRIVASIERNDPELAEKFKRGRESGMDNKRILSAIERRLQSNQPLTATKTDNSTATPQNASKSIPKQSPGIVESFKSGIRGSSTGEINKLLRGDLSGEPEVERDFVDSLSHSIGDIIGGIPAFVTGGIGGGSAGSVAGPGGTVAGAGVGAFGLDAFIKEALKQYREHSASGEDLTFGEFLQRAETVSGSTLRAGAMGGILSSINSAMPLLQNGPLGKLFNTKLKAQAGVTAAEVGALATVPAISEGRLPTANEFAHAAALVAGFKLTKAVADKIAVAGRDSGLTPEEFMETEAAQEILEPEIIARSKKQVTEDLAAAKTLANELPKSNKRNLANEAIKRGWIETPEQLDLFLDIYEDLYQGIPGKTGLSKNRKFMNRFIEDNLEVDYNVERSTERNLEIWRAQKRQANESGDKKLRKEAQKRIDLAKRKLENENKSTSKESEVSRDQPEAKANKKTKATKETVDNDYDFIETNDGESATLEVRPKTKPKETVTVASSAKEDKKSKKPPKENKFAQAATVVTGIKVDPEISEELEKAGRSSGMTPEDFARSHKAKEIIETAEILKEPQTPATKDLKDVDARIIKSSETAKARNLTSNIQVEAAKNDITVREPEKVEKSAKQVAKDLETTKALVNELPKSNKRNLANEAIKREWVRSPEQLDHFLDQYEAVYQGIPGKTGLSKNRKFMNRFAEENIEKREIKPSSEKAVADIKPSSKQKLEMGRTQKREAKMSGNKPKQREAQKRIDLAKRRVDKGLPFKIKRPVVSKFQMLIKSSDAKKQKAPPIKKPITEETGHGAEERLEAPISITEKIKKTGSEISEAAKNPNEVLHEIYTKTFDALEPLNRLEKDIPTEERVTTKIKQAQSAASDINNILTQGIFDNVSNTFSSESLKDAYTGMGEVWRKATKGLKDQEYSLREMDVYRTSKEALKRQKRGLKSGIDTKIATKDEARLKQKYGPIDQRIQQFQTKTLEHYGKDLLSPETRKQWSQDSHASLYRVMDYGNDAVVKEGSLAPKQPWYKAKGSKRKIIPPSESDIQNLSMLVTNAKKNDSILQYKKLVEQGKLPGRIVKSKNRELPEKMMEELGIDPENTQMAETIYNQSRKDAFTPETGRIRGWENGKPFEIEVPRDVYETYHSLAPTDTGMVTQIFKSTNNIMSKGIVFEPIKFLSIFGRDAYSSLIYSKTGSNPISIIKALTDIYGDSHSWNQFKSLGGEQYVSRMLTRSERVDKIESLLKADRPNAVLVPFHKLGKFLSKHSANLVASVPFAEYQRAVEMYGDTPSGRLQSLIEAKSVTYDPTKKGSHKLIKGAANFFPFFNVMLQEPAMIAKHMKRPMFWTKGAIGMTMPSLLLHMYNTGNEDYEDMNPLLKSSCWHFYTENGHFAVPVPWLLGALFKGAPEAFYEMVRGHGGDAFKGLYSYVASQLSGSFPPIVQAAVEQSTEKSLPSPAGLALMPFADVQKRAPPVVPRRLENLPPEQQYTSKTSQTARWFADLWGASPVKVERLAKTFGGGIATKSLALVDEMVYASGLAEDLRPEQGAKNYLLMGQFLSENTPTNTKYTEKFYNLFEQSKMDKKRGEESDYTKLNSYNSKISKKFTEYRSIEESSIDPKEKRLKLQEKQKQINDLYKEAVLKVTK